MDTIDIPAHTSLFAKMRLDDPVGGNAAAGRWLFHCHIAQEHAEHGMISEMIVS
jgi:FtsP/CotA-like multicopper oxidase with cupredoxin domain